VEYARPSGVRQGKRVHRDVGEWSIERDVAPEHLENREKWLEGVDVYAGASVGG
jgi:hypothetical protein